MFVPTRSSRLKQKTEETCQTIVFKTKKSKKPSVADEVVESQSETKNENERDTKLNMRKLRYEIIKFGSSGFDGSKKEESRIALAVSLGAKPPKKKSINYVKILAEKKAEKSKVDELNKKKLLKPVFKKGTLKRKNKNESKGLLEKYGKVQDK